MRDICGILHQKRAYILMCLLLAAILFFAPLILCWRGSFASVEWTGLSVALLVVAAIIFSAGAHFFLSKRSYFSLLVLFATFLLMPVWGAILGNIRVTWLDNEGLLCQSLIFALSMSGVALFVSALFKQIWLKRASFIIVSFVPVLFASVFIGYIFASRVWLNAEAVMMILITNPPEALEYCQKFLSFCALFALTVFFCVWICFSVYVGRLKCRIIGAVNAFLYGLLIVAIFYLGYRVMNQPALPYMPLMQEARKGCARYAEFEEKKKERMLHVNELVPEHEPNKGIYVLVIGESQNKKHMSAYGYDRETTPWLNSVRSQPGCILLTKARSCHTHTVRVLSHSLTLKNQYNDAKLEDSVTLIEAVKAAGFRTAWLSNQVKYGLFDTPTTVIASETDQQIWINHHVGEMTNTDEFDGALANEIKKLEYSDKMLIVVHLMGNHTVYSERYPNSFSEFSGRGNVVDTYDNSILYNDYVVQQIYEAVKAWPDFAGMIYMADHADDPDRDLGHDSSRFTWEMTQIPFYMIFSESYQREHGDILTALKNAQDKPFTNDLLFDMMLSVMGVRYTELYEPMNDITSGLYDANPERFRTLLGEKKIAW